ncbi:MAG: TrkH family potassium uptake protein [Desulfobulbus sp.]|nr:TrkH family potassium uptake protein [Desulfobulbus sp.]
MNSNRFLLLSFALAIVIGGVLLGMPISSTGDPIPMVDAFFTATSAVCVTGLSVVDPGTGFSRFGQVVILLLIQVGGLGIMTLSSMILMMLGQRVSLNRQDGVAQTYTSSQGTRLGTLLKRIFLVTFIIEFFGALSLFNVEIQQLPFGQAAWYATFHSISAFCNAGMSLRADNFIGYRDNFFVISTLSVLIVTGGLGFNVLSELFSNAVRRLRKLNPTVMTLHTKLSLCMTAILLVFGMAAYVLLEHHKSLSGLPLNEQFLTSFFASVTARTAGFNVVDYSHLTIPTLLLTMLLMLIGGCPGSTAGGIKATTFGVMLALLRSRFRAEEDVSLFHRTIPASTVARATALTVFAVLMIIVAAFALVYCEIGTMQYSDSTGVGLGLLFETVSAFCTVGLSTGLTAGLSIPGKIIVMILMYVGRIGPLTVAIAVARQQPKRMIRYVDEQVMIG